MNQRHTTPHEHTTQQPQHTADHRWHALSRGGKLAAHTAALISPRELLCTGCIWLQGGRASSCHPPCCIMPVFVALKYALWPCNCLATTPSAERQRHANHATQHPQQHTQQTIGGTPRQGPDFAQLPSISRSHDDKAAASAAPIYTVQNKPQLPTC
jgi:hypothetical protein